MAAPRGKKKRTPKPPRAVTPTSGGLMTPEQAVSRFGGLTHTPLRGDLGVLARVLESAEGDALVELFLPLLWANLGQGVPANICVDAGLALKYAYAQFGIASTIRVVDLVVEQASGRRRMFGTPTPSWSGPDGTVFNGHAILVLPGSGRYVDATVEQFDVVRRLNMGPLIGKTFAMNKPVGSGEILYAPGTMFVAKRGNLTLAYTIAEERYSEQIAAQPWVRHFARQHHRAGVNLASLALMALRNPDVIERARNTPYPRLKALLEAIGEAEDCNIDGNVHFLLPGPDGDLVPVTLDRIDVQPDALYSLDGPDD